MPHLITILIGCPPLLPDVSLPCREGITRASTNVVDAHTVLESLDLIPNHPLPCYRVCIVEGKHLQVESGVILQMRSSSVK